MNVNGDGKLRILLVDENRLQCDLYAKYLLSYPQIIAADRACSVAQAGKLLRTNTYHVMVISLAVRGNDTMTLLDSMRTGRIHRPEIVIVTAGIYDDNTLRALQRLGVSHLLEMPCSSEALLQCIRTLVSASKPEIRQLDLLYEWLVSKGCSPMRLGTRYLVNCVSICMQDNTLSLKEVYIACAQQCNTTFQNVESAVRSLKDCQKLCDALNSCAAGKLTNGKIIRLLAERKEIWINSSMNG